MEENPPHQGHHPLLHLDKDHLCQDTHQGNLQDPLQQVLFSHTLTLDKLLTTIQAGSQAEAKRFLRFTDQIQPLQTDKRNYHNQSLLLSGKVLDLDRLK